MKTNPKMSIKCRFTNLSFNKLNDYTDDEYYAKYGKYKKTLLTDVDKLKLFNEIFKDYKQINKELQSFKKKRKLKNKINKLREEKLMNSQEKN